MVVLMKPGAPDEQINEVLRVLGEYGLGGQVVHGVEETVQGRRSIIAMQGDETQVDTDRIAGLPGVEDVHRVSKPYKLVSKEYPPYDIQVSVQGKNIGNGNGLYIIGGPCAVEDEGWVLEAAHAQKDAGADALRGGVFKPRSSPYSFEGHGEKALKILAKAREETGLPIVATEVMDSSDIPLFKEYEVDIWQIGARGMMSYKLLDMVAESTADTPYVILLKRGMDARIDDWLLAAERLWMHGNPRVILCERGIRGFEDPQRIRNTPDVAAVVLARYLSKLPVFGDPTHSTGYSEYAPDIADAYIAAGVHGLEVEFHPYPEKAWCDGRESIRLEHTAPLFRAWRNLYETKKANTGLYRSLLLG